FDKARSIDANMDELALASDQRPRRPYCTKSKFEAHRTRGLTVYGGRVEHGVSERHHPESFDIATHRSPPSRERQCHLSAGLGFVYGSRIGENQMGRTGSGGIRKRANLMRYSTRSSAVMRLDATNDFSACCSTLTSSSRA